MFSQICRAKHIWIVILLACHCALAAARLSKRNGYHYKVPSGQPAHIFEPAHELPSAPEEQPHELAEHPSAPHPPASNNKYEFVYYDHKHTAPSGPSLSSSSSSSEHYKAGYSIGSGLRSIAQGSANQAYTAVANQHAAANQAAFIAKNTLAQAASQAAATAQAALAGKEVILQELEQQAAEAKRALSRELEQLHSAKIASKLAHQTAQAAFNHVSVLTAAINNAKAVADHAKQTANEVASQYASQSAMVGQSKNRLEQVAEQLKQARIDFEATKEAALKAASSAAEAQVNASQAAAHATIGLHESTNQHSDISSSGAGDESYDEHVDTSAPEHEDHHNSEHSHKK